MSDKIENIERSRKTHAGFLVALLVVVALLISAGSLALLVYLPKLSTQALGDEVLKSGRAQFASVRLVSEKKPVDGLPSNTLQLREDDSKVNKEDPFAYARKSIDSSDVESLVNTEVFNHELLSDDEKLSLKNGEYNFKFYSVSLNDYAEEGDFDSTVSMFKSVRSDGVARVSFNSKPLPSGGRIVDIDITSNNTYEQNGVTRFSSLWSNTVTNIASRVENIGDLEVNLIMRDNSGKLRLSATISDSESAELAGGLDSRLWETFDYYLNSTRYSFLKVQRITYAVERTSEDSVFRLHLDEGHPSKDEILAGLSSRAHDETLEEQVLFPWSFLTYFMSPEGEIITMKHSTSRNW